jgi:hypothetical protein
MSIKKLSDVAGAFLEASIGHTDGTDLKDKHRWDLSVFIF